MLRHTFSRDEKLNELITQSPGTRKNLRYSSLLSFLSVSSYVMAPLTAYLATDDVDRKSDLLKGTIILVALLIFGRLLTIPRNRFVTKAATSLGNHMHHRVIDQIWNMPLGNQIKGDANSHLTNMIRANVVGTPGYLPNLYSHIYPSSLQQLLSSGALMYFNLPVGSSLLGACFLFHALSYYLARWSETPQRKLDRSAFGVYAGMSEAGHSYTLVHSTGGYKEGHERLEQSTSKYAQAFEVNERRREWIALVSLMFTVVFAGAVGSVAYFTTNADHEVKELILSFAYLVLLHPTFASLLNSSSEFNRARTSIDSITDFLAIESSVSDQVDAIDLRIDPAQAKIEFKDVTFIRGDRKILDNVSFIVQPGQKVVFAGENGSGKSTILRLLMRYDEIDGGAIYINDIDTRDLTRRSLLAAFANFAQQRVFFRGTFQENILFGHYEDRSQYKTDQELLRTTLHEVGLDEFKDTGRLSDDVGYDGNTLSGGQKQKGEFARLCLRLKKPDTVICCFDEPEASLDSKAEALTNTLIKRISSGYTVCMVTHSFAAMQDADVIFVLDKGKIAQQGDFNDLKSREGIFSRLLQKYCVNHDKNPEDLIGQPRDESPRGSKRVFELSDRNLISIEDDPRAPLIIRSSFS